MKRLYVIVVTVVILMYALTLRAEGITIETDKTLHFTAGAGVGILANAYMDSQYKLAKKEKDIEYYILPVLSVVSIATLKELSDNTFDWKDWGYTLFGGGVAITVVNIKW